MGNTNSSTVQTCLENALGGQKDLVAFKGSPLYQAKHVKPYNLGIPITPAAVTYPQTSEQIAAIVKCAVDSSLKVQPRSGGHSFANYGIGGQDNAIVVDLKNLQQFSMDQSTWQATIGSGTLLGDVTKRLHDNGNRAMAHGTCPQVGIGGHATIGGLGPPSRMWGASLDHVEEVEVVLANSSIVRASNTQNPDIFFAIKGAAAGFGIVTEFKVRTQAEPGESVKYSYKLHGNDLQSKSSAFKQWQKIISDSNLSRKFASQFILAPQVGAIVTGTFFGTRQEYDSLNITGRLPDKDEDIEDVKDWLGLVGHWTEDVALKIVGGIPSNFYAKSLAYTDKDLLSDADVDNLFSYIEKTDKGGAIWFIVWDLAGGAVNDVAPDATAYGRRDTLFYHQAYAVNLVGKVSSTTRDFLTGIGNQVQTALHGKTLGTYAGYVDPALGGESSAVSYWGNNVGRLRDIKEQVDPLDVFSNPQSIRPAKQS